MMTITATLPTGFAVVTEDGSIEQADDLTRAALTAALAQDHEGAYATEEVVGDAVVLADAIGSIPHGTLAHTIAAIESLDGVVIDLSEDGNEA